MTHLGTICSNQVQRSHGAGQEARDLQEVVVPDGPGAVHQEDQLGLGLLTHLRHTHTHTVGGVKHTGSKVHLSIFRQKQE